MTTSEFRLRARSLPFSFATFFACVVQASRMNRADVGSYSPTQADGFLMKAVGFSLQSVPFRATMDTVFEKGGVAVKYFTKDWYARMQRLGICPSQEEGDRLRPDVEAPVDAYRAYTAQNNLSAIDRRLDFHNQRVILAQRKGDDFCLFLGHDADTASILLRFVNAQMIGQELTRFDHAEYRWLYHEIYLTATGYELKMLLAADDALYEWSIQCARMELTEVKD